MNPGTMRALITGGAGGIGGAIADELLARGASVLLVDRDEAALRRTTGRLSRYGERVGTLAADLTSAADRQRLCAEASTWCGGINVLINNAGVNHFRMFADQPAEQLDLAIAINLLAPMHLCRELLPHLQRQPEACIQRAGNTAMEEVVMAIRTRPDVFAGLETKVRGEEIYPSSRLLASIIGIGERAGNTSLEEVVMTLHTRRGVFGLRTGIDTTQIARTSRMVSNYTGIPVQPNKAIVGANAFAHEAGIHQDGMLKHQTTYEIMRPETVGVTASSLVLGKHSGRHALKSRLAELGYALPDRELDRAFAEFKKLADKKKVIANADLEAIVSNCLSLPRPPGAIPSKTRSISRKTKWIVWEST